MSVALCTRQWSPILVGSPPVRFALVLETVGEHAPDRIEESLAFVGLQRP